MSETADNKSDVRSGLLRAYKKKCLLLGTLGWGGFMSIVLFTSIPKEEVKISWPVLLGVAAITAILGGALWGILFYFVSRNGFLKRNGA